MDEGVEENLKGQKSGLKVQNIEPKKNKKRKREEGSRIRSSLELTARVSDASAAVAGKWKKPVSLWTSRN